MVLILLPPWEFDTQITSEKNIYLDGGWLLIGRFKVVGLSIMINKELLAQFIYKPT